MMPALEISLLDVTFIGAVVACAVHVEHRLTKVETVGEQTSKYLRALLRALNIDPDQMGEN